MRYLNDQDDVDFANGRVIMQDGKIADLDEAGITVAAWECAERTWGRFDNS